jgi:Mrp family chromosome partitioning ATPase
VVVVRGSGKAEGCTMKKLGRMIALASGKGGVGKSTLALALAA